MTTKGKISVVAGVAILVVLCSIYVINLFSEVTNKMEGNFGQSESKQDAIVNDLYVADYRSSQDTITLMENGKITIGEVWAETMWSHHNRQPKKAEDLGYNLHLEFERTSENLVFSLEILDKNNEAFTNGVGEDRCVFNPRNLHDTIDVLVEEPNPDNDIGWRDPIVTDTISLIRQYD